MEYRSTGVLEDWSAGTPRPSLLSANGRVTWLGHTAQLFTFHSEPLTSSRGVCLPPRSLPKEPSCNIKSEPVHLAVLYCNPSQCISRNPVSRKPPVLASATEVYSFEPTLRSDPFEQTPPARASWTHPLRSSGEIRFSPRANG